MYILTIPGILSAAVFDWDLLGWPAESLSENYIDVDASKIDISVNITGDTNRFNAGYPTDNTDSLSLRVNFANTQEQVTTTIRFSTPVLITNLSLRDIDSGTFNDKVIVSGKDMFGNTLAPNIL